MSIYDVINSILFKKGIDKSAIEEMHVPFMFIRWLAFYDPSVIPLANELNRIAHQFHDKQDSYNFFNTVVPKLRYKKIPYIKKTKATPKRKADEKREEQISRLAYANEVSCREAKMYLEMIDMLD
jgi:hypothetical protein